MELPEHLIASNEYGTYCVPASSRLRPAARAVLAGKIWEPETVAFMAENCGEGDIVHAGTYFGDFIPGLSKALHTGALLWAFEPSSENYACARRTMELNGIANTTLTHAGLGARSELSLLCTGWPNRAMGGSSRLVRKKKPGFAYEEIRVVAVDEAVPAARTVTILQLDVERYEQQALAGALRTIKRCMPILILENLPEDSVWFEQTIIALGYRQDGKLHANTVFRAES
jgi:FkbM family methyltransferase